VPGRHDDPEVPMKYMLLIYGPPDRAELSPEQAAAEMPRWFEFQSAVEEAGAFVAGDPLEGLPTATTVRVRDGETLITDGPFAETKEMLGGYYILDVPDLDAALGWAARMPNITYGSVEVRPIMEIPQEAPQG
jgi:hypothetical protein